MKISFSPWVIIALKVWTHVVGQGPRLNWVLPRGVNQDAWRWSDDSYVPRDLLVGKALVVFWPHSWNSPVPFLPNFKRMKLIR